jgi:hypothetical protein
MQNDFYVDQTMPLTAQLSVSGHDWEVRLALIISEDIGDVAALMAYDDQRVRITLSRPTCGDQ